MSDTGVKREEPSGEEAETLVARARREAVELVRFLGGAALVFVVIITLFFRVFYIPSSSMEPTLEVGDRVLVLTPVYGYSRNTLPFGLGDLFPRGEGRLFGSTPKRGHVVVFRHPNTGENLIKRVVGVPGDRIEMRGGRLYVNGTIAERDFDREVRYRDYRALPGGREKPIITAQRFTETLPGGKTHAIYELSDRGDLDGDALFIVPARRIFVMGDNRDSSNDSRNVADLGFVPVEALVGRAVTVLFTFKRCDRRDAEARDLECPTGRVWRGL